MVKPSNNDLMCTQNVWKFARLSNLDHLENAESVYEVIRHNYNKSSTGLIMSAELISMRPHVCICTIFTSGDVHLTGIIPP